MRRSDLRTSVFCLQDRHSNCYANQAQSHDTPRSVKQSNGFQTKNETMETRQILSLNYRRTVHEINIFTPHKLVIVHM